MITRYILTGAPGSGKTSVILELEKLGHVVIHEAATDIIENKQKEGNYEPWQDSKFIDAIIMLQKQRQIETLSALQFHDRSPICTYALCNYLKFEPSEILKHEVNRTLKEKIYHKKVFFLENLGFIENTNARKINFEEALRFEKMHEDIYKELGFEIVKIPVMPIVDRMNFILNLAG